MAEFVWKETDLVTNYHTDVTTEPRWHEWRGERASTSWTTLMDVYTHAHNENAHAV